MFHSPLKEASDNGAASSQVNQYSSWESQTASPTASLFADGAPGSYDDFDSFGGSPINGVTAPATYTVRSGDTLQSVAQALWGDANLWYLIADANSLSAGQTLAAGTTLFIPANVTNLHNTSATNLVYSQANIVGDVQPTAVAAPRPVAPQSAGNGDSGCGGIGEVLVAIVAVAVTAWLAPELEGEVGTLFNGGTALAAGSTSAAAVGGDIVGGGLAGALGSTAGQLAGLATGVQNQFNWNAVALGALGGAISGGLGGELPNSDSIFGENAFAAGAVRGALSSALTQGVGVATGLQSSFSWAGVAAAGLGGGVASQVGGENWGGPQGSVGNTFISGAAGGIANAAAYSVLTGADFGTSLIEQLPSVIGNTIGQGIAEAEEQQSQPQTSSSGAASSYGAGAINWGSSFSYAAAGSGSSQQQSWAQQELASVEGLGGSIPDVPPPLALSDSLVSPTWSGSSVGSTDNPAQVFADYGTYQTPLTLGGQGYAGETIGPSPTLGELAVVTASNAGGGFWGPLVQAGIDLTNGHGGYALQDLSVEANRIGSYWANSFNGDGYGGSAIYAQNLGIPLTVADASTRRQQAEQQTGVNQSARDPWMVAFGGGALAAPLIVGGVAAAPAVAAFGGSLSTTGLGIAASNPWIPVGGLFASQLALGAVSGETPSGIGAAGSAAESEAGGLTTQTLFRGDGRVPETIFNEGFVPRGTSTDLQAYVDTNNSSAFVGTSTSEIEATKFALANDGHVYQIDPTGLPGINVNSAYPTNTFAYEQEIAIPGGVPRESIIGAQRALPGGGLGPVIPNPFYKAP